jgi:polygalacturonase
MGVFPAFDADWRSRTIVGRLAGNLPEMNFARLIRFLGDLKTNLKHRTVLFSLFVATTLALHGVDLDNASMMYNVRSFGALGNGQQLDSPSINKAIDACAQAGGGTVYIPAGTYLSGSIHLKSHIELHLAAGAVILGAPQSMKAYDPAETFEGRAYQDGGHTYFHNSLIWGENLTNVSITGQGMINGGGMTKEDGPRDYGNKSIVLKNCRSVLIRDVTILHGGHFAILTTGCDNLTIDNVTIDTNRDGMDLDCCRNTVVSNCRINSPTDDGLCPKSTYALGRRVITENLTIVNCQVSGFKEGTLLDGSMVPERGGTGRIKFGTESSGGFRNVTVANSPSEAVADWLWRSWTGASWKISIFTTSQ